MTLDTCFHFWSIVGALTCFGWQRTGRRRWGEASLPRRPSGVFMRNALNLLFWRGLFVVVVVIVFVFNRKKLKTLSGLYLVAFNYAFDL